MLGKVDFEDGLVVGVPGSVKLVVVLFLEVALGDTRDSWLE